MQKVSKIGLKMATGYKKCIEDRWTVENLLVSAKGQLSTDRYKCLLQKSEKRRRSYPIDQEFTTMFWRMPIVLFT